MSQVRLITAADFTGGLNLRADAFQLGENESPDMLNVEVDPRGGFRSRLAWTDWALIDETEELWDPRSLYPHGLGNGTEVLFLTNGSDLWIRPHGGTFAKAAGVVCGGDPHAADFATWNDDAFITCGRNNVSQRWRASVLTAMTDPSTASNWSDDPLDPKSDTMPKAEFTCVHNGYLWVANTNEGGVNYPHRIRFSFPNDPDAWASLDFIDIPDGNGPITGIMPLGDQLLVFTPSAVFAIVGYDLDSFARNEVTRTVGAVNRQCIARSETAVYFASWPEGVHRVTSEAVEEVSVSLRPAIESSQFSPDTDLQWLGWAGQRLYWSVPFDKDGAPIGTRTMFVFDPSIESWTKHRSGCGCGVAPIVDGGELGKPIGTTRFGPSVLNMSGQDTGVDVVLEEEFPIPSYYRTRWFNDGLPTIKKRWRRPDYVADEDDTTYHFEVRVYHDYDEANAKRTQTISVNGGGAAGTWFEDPEWDGSDASLATPPEGAPIWSLTEDPAESSWGLAPSGGSIERGSSLGASPAIQLEFVGQAGRRWGVNAIVLKYLLRRVR